MRPERRRHFGHPSLVDFVEKLGETLAQAKLPPLGVGDLGQARGGPAPNGHASHQSGLDVDLWFSPASPAKQQHSMVDLASNGKSPYWSNRVGTLLRTAAGDERVARIFVNPIIKKQLCDAEKPEGRGWLRKLRPWHGHHEHFHVRLGCPPGSPGCSAQPPVPEGDGCGELDWWLDPDKQEERRAAGAKYGKRVGARPALPEQCAKVAKAEAAAPPAADGKDADQRSAAAAGAEQGSTRGAPASEKRRRTARGRSSAREPPRAPAKSAPPR